MAKAKFNFTIQGDFIAGEFHNPVDPNGEWVCRSPADFSDELGKFQYSYASVDEAVRSARQALSKWKLKLPAERAEYLRKYQAALKRRQDELAEAIAREIGKPLWEAKTEISGMQNKVEATVNESGKWITPFEIPKVMENTVGTCRYKPLGVMAVIGPFNLPGHLSNGHIIPALFTGNTVVFKPSEKAALVGQLMAECFQEAGLPAGVFNLVQGEKEVGRRLCVHEGVNGVLFTGSYEVGTRIKQDTLQQHWKLLVLEMGGKNPAIVWSDAQMDVALHECLLGAFLTAGQRCSATSRIIIHNKILDEFLDHLHDRAKAFSIGHPLDNPFMGPLVDESSVDRYMKFLGIASREGCEVIMRGKSLELSVHGNYVTPSICWVKNPSLELTRKSIYQQTELFLPNVAILGVSDLDEAIAQANATQYGLVASIFTRSRSIYEKCWDNLEMGLIHWNRATVGASSRLPFGGMKKSGNYFPTGITAAAYCTTCISSLEVADPQPVTEAVVSKTPGLNWK